MNRERVLRQYKNEGKLSKKEIQRAVRKVRHDKNNVISEDEWKAKRKAWRREWKTFLKENSGKLFCVHKYKVYDGPHPNKHISANVQYKYGTTYEYESKGINNLLICVKCGRIRPGLSFSYDD